MICLLNGVDSCNKLLAKLIRNINQQVRSAINIIHDVTTNLWNSASLLSVQAVGLYMTTANEYIPRVVHAWSESDLAYTCTIHPSNRLTKAYRILKKRSRRIGTFSRTTVNLELYRNIGATKELTVRQSTALENMLDATAEWVTSISELFVGHVETFYSDRECYKGVPNLVTAIAYLYRKCIKDIKCFLSSPRTPVHSSDLPIT